MSTTEQVLLGRARDRLPDVLHYMDDTGARQYAVNGKPSIKGGKLVVPLDVSLSYARLQAIAPAWVTLVDFAPGVAHFELNERAARAALD